MDKLAKIFFKNPDPVYKYKEKFDVPVLGMVDDVLSVTKCSKKRVISNATINSFVELNKLKLFADNCSKIHIGKNCDKCMILGTSGVIWGDLGTFCDFRMQNHSV